MKVQESRENYLEAILVLSKQGPVRSIDVANYLEFSKPSVSVAVANMKAAGLLAVDENGHLRLSDSGHALAEQVYERHTLLAKCLETLGVDPQVAAEDACRIEHVISQQTFDQIKAHIGRNAGKK